MESVIAKRLLLRDIILRSHSVTLELILGAINIYLMVGLAFAFMFGLIEHLQPGSFAGLAEKMNAPDSILNFIYFSFITLNTMGYGDITPPGRVLLVRQAEKMPEGISFPAFSVARFSGICRIGITFQGQKRMPAPAIPFGYISLRTVLVF